MKKLLSLALVAIMLFAAIAAAIPVSALATSHTTSDWFIANPEDFRFNSFFD